MGNNNSIKIIHKENRTTANELVDPQNELDDNQN